MISNIIIHFLAINDWEKIYDLPPHSSQVTNKDPPPNIDVRKRTQLFEKQAVATPYQHQHRSGERRVSESVCFKIKDFFLCVTQAFFINF